MSDLKPLEVLRARYDGWARQRWIGLLLGVFLLLMGGGMCVSVLLAPMGTEGTPRPPLSEFDAATFLMLAMLGAGLVAHVVRNWRGNPVVGAILALYSVAGSGHDQSEATERRDDPRYPSRIPRTPSC